MQVTVSKAQISLCQKSISDPDISYWSFDNGQWHYSLPLRSGSRQR